MTLFAIVLFFLPVGQEKNKELPRNTSKKLRRKCFLKFLQHYSGVRQKRESSCSIPRKANSDMSILDAPNSLRLVFIDNFVLSAWYE